MTGRPVGVLFVCMGNICRSPLAEGVFEHLARQRMAQDRFRIDSAGTGGWHTGNTADPRSAAVAAKHGITLTSLARQIDPPSDFLPPEEGGFDHIIVMDTSNLNDCLRSGADPQRTALLRSFDPQFAGDGPHKAPGVPDPYYGGPDGFEDGYRMIHAACTGLLDQLDD